ncbi:MAG: hypothetical protein WA130_11170 [Candidatus Methanoperedens sp.]
MRVKVQKYNGRLLGCCMTIPPEMMETLGVDVLSDYVELAIEKTPDGLLVKRIDGIKDKEIVPEFRKYDNFMANRSLITCHLNAEW